MKSTKIIRPNRGPMKMPKELKLEWQDKRSLAIKKIIVGEISLENALGPGEKQITSGLRLKRLQEAGYILLDVAFLFALNRDQDLIPDSWKSKAKDGIFFEGTRVLTPYGAPGITSYRLYHCPGLTWSGYWSVNGDVLSDYELTIAQGYSAVLKR